MTAAEPLPVTVTRYQCPFCRKTRARKHAAREHISRCWLNPATRSCKTCLFFTDEPDGDYCTGQPCGCNQGFRQCDAGVPGVAEGKIITGCPLWKSLA